MFELPVGWENRIGHSIAVDIETIRAERRRTVGAVSRFKNPITRVFCVPRLINLAGEFYTVSELRLIDLAEWQAWLEDQTDHPLADLPPIIPGDDSHDRMNRLANAWDLAANWPPKIGSPEAARFMATGGGRAHFLWLCLKRHHPDVTLEAIITLGGKMTADDWRRLSRVAWAITPQAELTDELAPELNPPSGTDWPKAIASVLESYPAWTFDQIGELTLTQWRLIGTGGKQSKEEAGRVKRAGNKVKGFRAKQAE